MRNDFVTREQGNFSFHLLPSEKYVQTTIAVRIHLDLDEKMTTGAALLPYILLHGSERFRNDFIIQSKLDEEYGAKLGVSIDKKGDKQVLCLSLKFYNQKHKMIKPEILTVLLDLLTQPLITKKSVELEKSSTHEESKMRFLMRIIIRIKRVFYIYKEINKNCISIR